MINPMKQRYWQPVKGSVYLQEVNDFIAEIHGVCRKHRMCIEHEDTHGSFIVEAYDNDLDLDWFNHASIGSTIKVVVGQ